MEKDKKVADWSRADLLDLPLRRWSNEAPLYTSLIITAARGRHESGWANIAIIGCKELIPVEVCTTCSDDIEWLTPGCRDYGNGVKAGWFRSDMLFKAKALHFWSRYYDFRVGAALSSTRIELIQNEEHTNAKT